MNQDTGGCGCGPSCCASADAAAAVPTPTPPATGEPMTTLSRYTVPGMDCPAEERLIRIALDGLDGVGTLTFDLQRRELGVQHRAAVDAVTARLTPLGMGAQLLDSRPLSAEEAGAPVADTAAGEAGVLRWLLVLNAAMFVVEIIAGWIGQSTGLMADALDMLADAGVYGVALYAVGRAASLQLRAARLSGLLQIALATGMLVEVLRRYAGGSTPEPPLMMWVSLLALAVNVSCVALLARHREGAVHMRASWIFSTNDALANLGVIAAGALVAWTGSNLPDLLIGTLIALLVFSGAWRILRLRA